MSKKYEQAYSYYDTSVYTSNVAIGGKNGSEFNYGAKKDQYADYDATVRSLKAWYDGDTMRGLKVELTDDSSAMYGTAKGKETETFKLKPGEKVSSLKVWGGDYDGGSCGGFKMTTTKKRSFDVPAPRKGDAYEYDVGSGILVGVYGKSGSDVDCLGFNLLRSDRSSLYSGNYA